MDSTAGGGALADAGPVVDNLQPDGFTRHKGHHRLSVIIQRGGNDNVGKQCAGRVELAAAQAQAVSVLSQACRDFTGMAGVFFRATVAEAQPLYHGAENRLLLGGRAFIKQ